jgi:DNA-binding transcriptional ArsR family regulator
MGASADIKTGTGVDPRILKLLGHPLRLEVFSKLGEQPWSATQLAPVLGEDWRRIREQIRVLVKEGLAEPVGTEPGPHGGRLTLYRAIRFYFTAADWAALPEAIRATGSFTFMQLLFKDAFGSLDAGMMDSREDRVLIRHPLWTDSQGAKEIEKIKVRAHEEVEAVERRSLARRKASDEEPIRLVTAVIAFPVTESGGRISPP